MKSFLFTVCGKFPNKRWLILCLLSATFLGNQVRGQDGSPCNSDIKPDESQGELKFKPRDEGYCEGFVSEKISGEPFKLVQFTKGTISYDPQVDNFLQVKAGKGAEPVRAVIRGIRSNIQYRLEKEGIDGNGFNWNLERIVNSPNTRIMPDALGGYGLMEVGLLKHKVYVPLEIVRMTPEKRIGQKLTVIYRATESISFLQWRIRKGSEIIQDYTALDKDGMDYWRAESPIKIFLPKLADGEYIMEVLYETSVDFVAKKETFRILVN